MTHIILLSISNHRKIHQNQFWNKKISKIAKEIIAKIL